MIHQGNPADTASRGITSKETKEKIHGDMDPNRLKSKEMYGLQGTKKTLRKFQTSSKQKVPNYSSRQNPEINCLHIPFYRQTKKITAYFNVPRQLKNQISTNEVGQMRTKKTYRQQE